MGLGNKFPTSREIEYAQALGWLEAKHKRPISLAEVAERTGMSIGAVQAAVHSLHKKGYAEKKTPVIIAKSLKVSGQWGLTAAGRKWL